MSDASTLPLPELIAAIEARGARLYVEDGKLQLQARGKVTEAEKQRLRDAKPQVIALLQGEAKGPIGPFAEEGDGSVSGGTLPNAEPDPEPVKVQLGWSASAPPRRPDPMLPPWRQGDPSKVRLVKTTSSGLRIYHG